MLNEHLFAYLDVFPSWWANAVGKMLSIYADGFKVTHDTTNVYVVAGAGDQAAVVSIGGMWRWNEATLTRAHPGGAAGTYPIFVTAAANDIVGIPAPFTDSTTYSFGLDVRAAGSTPTIVAGTVDVYRQVGTCEWDGTQITRVDQTVPASPLHAHSHAAGQPDAISPASIGAAALVQPVVTSLPTVGPSGSGPLLDGQECRLLVDATNGIVWHLAYRAGSSSPYKWEFLGGSSLLARVNGSLGVITVGGVWNTAGGGAPAVTVPNVGDYEVDFGCNVQLIGPGGGTLAEQYYAEIGLLLNGASPPFGSGLAEFLLRAVTSTTVIDVTTTNIGSSRRLLALASGTVISTAFLLGLPAHGSGAYCVPQDAYLRVKPIRIA